jgi:hypothetical protein
MAHPQSLNFSADHYLALHRAQRLCKVCGTPINAKRVDAATCPRSTCRVRLHRGVASVGGWWSGEGPAPTTLGELMDRQTPVSPSQEPLPPPSPGLIEQIDAIAAGAPPVPVSVLFPATAQGLADIRAAIAHAGNAMALARALQCKAESVIRVRVKRISVSLQGGRMI